MFHVPAAWRISFDEGNYGFYGLEVVLDRLAAAAEQEVDLQELIEKHGLVV
ncbi:MAG: hypothetical protein ACLTSZ_14545 [Lachnospiraceae bacterium]